MAREDTSPVIGSHLVLFHKAWNLVLDPMSGGYVGFSSMVAFVSLIYSCGGPSRPSSSSADTLSAMIKRGIERYEVERAIIKGEIIEEYPDDKYSPSCLIYGETDEGRSLHMRVPLPPTVVIITTYEPDINEWIDFKIRR